MNGRIVLLIVLLIIAVVYYLKTYTDLLDMSTYSYEKKQEKVDEYPWDTPPDWTFDWDGGHGKSRHDIMMEPGPYVQPVDVQMVPNVPNL
jgi:hypothetical protein